MVDPFPQLGSYSFIIYLLFSFLFLFLSLFSLNFCLNLILYAFLLLHHSTFIITFFIYDVNFTFSLCIPPIPYFISTLLVLLPLPSQNYFLSVDHLIFALLSYNSLNTFTPVLILVHLLLIVELWVGVSFADMGLFPGLCNYIQDMVGIVTLSQPAGG